MLFVYLYLCLVASDVIRYGMIESYTELGAEQLD